MMLGRCLDSFLPLLGNNGDKQDAQLDLEDYPVLTVKQWTDLLDCIFTIINSNVFEQDRFLSVLQGNSVQQRKVVRQISLMISISRNTLLPSSATPGETSDGNSEWEEDLSFRCGSDVTRSDIVSRNSFDSLSTTDRSKSNVFLVKELVNAAGECPGITLFNNQESHLGYSFISNKDSLDASHQLHLWRVMKFLRSNHKWSFKKEDLAQANPTFSIRNKRNSLEFILEALRKSKNYAKKNSKYNATTLYHIQVGRVDGEVSTKEEIVQHVEDAMDAYQNTEGMFSPQDNFLVPHMDEPNVFIEIKRVDYGVDLEESGAASPNDSDVSRDEFDGGEIIFTTRVEISQSHLQSDLASIIGDLRRKDGKSQIIAAPIDSFGKTSFKETMKLISSLISAQSMRSVIRSAKKNRNEQNHADGIFDADEAIEPVVDEGDDEDDIDVGPVVFFFLISSATSTSTC
jgi:hypothetical protein